MVSIRVGLVPAAEPQAGRNVNRQLGTAEPDVEALNEVRDEVKHARGRAPDARLLHAQRGHRRLKGPHRLPPSGLGDGGLSAAGDPLHVRSGYGDRRVVAAAGAVEGSAQKTNPRGVSLAGGTSQSHRID